MVVGVQTRKCRKCRQIFPLTLRHGYIAHICDPCWGKIFKKPPEWYLFRFLERPLKRIMRRHTGFPILHICYYCGSEFHRSNKGRPDYYKSFCSYDCFCEYRKTDKYYEDLIKDIENPKIIDPPQSKRICRKCGKQFETWIREMANGRRSMPHTCQDCFLIFIDNVSVSMANSWKEGKMRSKLKTFEEIRKERREKYTNRKTMRKCKACAKWFKSWKRIDGYRSKYCRQCYVR